MSLTVSPLHHPRVGGRHAQAVPMPHRILRIAWALAIGATIGAGILAVMAHFAARSDAPSGPSGPSCDRAAVCLAAIGDGDA